MTVRSLLAAAVILGLPGGSALAQSTEAVATAAAELSAAGHRMLRGAHEEPWGQTTARFLSPEGLLVGVTFTPWMHEDAPGPITES